jgi:hypothetical protein
MDSAVEASNLVCAPPYDQLSWRIEWLRLRCSWLQRNIIRYEHAVVPESNADPTDHTACCSRFRHCPSTRFSTRLVTPSRGWLYVPSIVTDAQFLSSEAVTTPTIGSDPPQYHEQADPPPSNPGIPTPIWDTVEDERVFRTEPNPTEPTGMMTGLEQTDLTEGLLPASGGSGMFA